LAGYNRQAGSNGANRVCRDYFRIARHSTGIRGSAAWIRDFHEETNQLARRYSVPQLNKNMVFHDRFGIKPSSGKGEKRVWAATGKYPDEVDGKSIEETNESYTPSDKRRAG
jgi:hypothetical protein